MSDYKSLTDAKLVALLRQSNHAGYTEMYNRFFNLLYQFVQKRIGDEDQAHDIVQDVFTIVWIKRETSCFDQFLPQHLYTSVRNKMLTVIAKNDQHKKYLRSLHDYLDKDSMVADYQIREKQLAALIESEVNKLPKRMREVFLMSRNQHMTYKEIAAELNLTPMSVKDYGKDAIKRLRSKLGFLIR